MGQIYHIPQAITCRHMPVPLDDTAAILECANLVAKYRYGVPALMLPTEARELVIEFLTDLWRELDDLPQGRAS